MARDPCTLEGTGKIGLGQRDHSAQKLFPLCCQEGEAGPGAVQCGEQGCGTPALPWACRDSAWHSSNLSCGWPGPAGGVLQMARPAQQPRSHEPGSREGDVGVWCVGARCALQNGLPVIAFAKAAVSE